MTKYTSRVFAILSIAMAACAAYSVCVPPTATQDVAQLEHAFTIHALEQDVGRVRLGKRAVAFEITNASDRSRRILGNVET